jgi:hypothetical protein
MLEACGWPEDQATKLARAASDAEDRGASSEDSQKVLGQACLNGLGDSLELRRKYGLDK